jgi:hypothetical protein
MEENKETFISAAKIVLRDNNNKPMTCNEIWNKIIEIDLYKSTGLTPELTLNALLRRNSKNSSVKIKSQKLTFLTIDGSPNKFQLLHYVPEHIKESFIEEGFITIDKYNELRLELDKIKDILIKTT